jgi:aryl-alcohol dehydrogenase-like predicted oxidoreductase
VIIAWMRHSDPLILPIIGGSTTERLAENLAALDVHLTDEQMQRLNEAGA